MYKKRIIILAVVMAILSGCGLSYYSSSTTNKFAIGKTSHISNYRVLQAINKHFVLAIDDRIVVNPLVIAIKTSEGHSPFYDGQIISGWFEMTDTYTYETMPDENGRTRIKTVPLVIPKE